MICIVQVLSDLNVLLALASNWHVHHKHAIDWMSRREPGEVVVIRVVQLGMLRLLNSPAFSRETRTAAECWEVWEGIRKDERIKFVEAEPLGIDEQFKAFMSGHKVAPKLWTDAYLAAFAVTGGYRLATLDRGFARYPGLEVELIG